MRKLIRSLYFILFGLVIYLLFMMFDNSKTVDIRLNEDREYLQPLQFKSVLSKDSGIYFTNYEQTNFNNIQSNRVFKARGFQFCKILDGATFDALVDIKDFGSSVAEKNPDWSEFINLIDSRAYDIYQALLRKFHRADQNEVKRLACYTAGEGQTVVANLTYNRLLQEIHPVNYFKDILPAIIPNRNRIGDKSRKKYRLAYLLMAHDKNGYLALVKLLELLDDGNAIILIHIDARPNSDALFDSIEEFVSERKRSRPNSAIFMAKHRIANIWGHISLVFTQLSGFWELFDLADWEYVINISNYDYPLKKNSQIYKYLSQPQYKGQNFIEYWQDTSDIAERFYRVHLGVTGYHNVYHPGQMGVVSWPYNNWKAVKHHQWMILTPEAVQFLRHDTKSLTFLSFAEHSYIPDESYFGTVLVNAPQFLNKIINNNRRYLRFSGSAHPSWLGFQDRHLFPPFEDDPSYFFIRKFNSVGNNFEEKKLINWIEKYHYDEGPPPECNIQMMSVRKECLKQIGSEIAYKSQIIVIPVNVPFWNNAQNLQCSLLKLGIKNAVYWALDLEIYETLLNAGSMTIYLPGVDPSPLLILPNSPDLNNIMRAKTKVIKMFMDAGFDLWFLDSDTVVLKDFRDIVPGHADVLVALDNIEYLKKGPQAAKPSTGIMFFKNSKGGQSILNLYIESLQLAMLLDDQNGLSRILTKVDAVKTLMPGEVPKNPIKTPVVQYLNPFSFINSNVFISNPQAIPAGFKDYYIFHTKSKRDHVDTLQSLGYWFLDDEMRCHLIISAPQDNEKRLDVEKKDVKGNA